MTVFVVPSAKVFGVFFKGKRFWCFGAKFTEHMELQFTLQFCWHAKQGISMVSFKQFSLGGKVFLQAGFSKRNAFQFSKKRFFNM